MGANDRELHTIFVSVRTRVLEDFVTSGSVLAAEDWVWLYGYGAPPNRTEEGTNGQEVGSAGTYIDEDTVAGGSKEPAVNDPVYTTFG